MSAFPKTFYISPAGGSGNMGMSTFLACPAKAKLYMDGWRRKKVSHPMAFGILEHKALFDPRIIQEEKRQPADIFEHLYKRGKIPPYKKKDGSMEKEMEIDFTDNKGMAINKGEQIRVGKILATLADQELNNREIKNIEVPMSVSILDPETGREMPEADGFFMCGRKDIQRKDGITDLKTSARSLNEDDVKAGPYHFQLSSYRYMTIIQEGYDYKNLEILNAVNKRQPEIKSFEMKGVDEDLLVVFQTFIWVVRQIKEFTKNDYWPRNPAACKQWGLCEFHPICFPGKYSRPDLEIKNKLYKKGY